MRPRIRLTARDRRVRNRKYRRLTEAWARASLRIYEEPPPARMTQAEEAAVRAIAGPVQEAVAKLLAAGARGPFEARAHPSSLPVGMSGLTVYVTGGHRVPVMTEPFAPADGTVYVIDTSAVWPSMCDPWTWRP